MTLAKGGKWAFAAFLSVFLPGAAMAQDPDLGTHWPLMTTFATKPVRAIPTKGSACEVAEAYVNVVDTGGGDKIAPLFAPDAEFLGPVDRVMKGRTEIAGFFAKVPTLVRNAVPISFVDRGNECFMELAVNTIDASPDNYRLLAIDHFTIDKDRLIRRLVIYFRPASAAQAAKMK